MLADSSRFRQSTAGWALRLAFLCLVVSALLRPDWGGAEDELLDRLARDQDAALGATLVGLLGCALLVPAVLALMHMLRERATAAGHLTGILALLGTLGLIFHYVIELVVWTIARNEDATAGAAGVTHRLLSEPVISAGFEYLPVALGVGLAALAVVLRAARAVEPWTAYAVVLGAPLAATGLLVAHPTLLKAGWGVVLAGANKIGRRVLEQDDEDWAHWPAWTFTWTWKR